MPVTMASEKTSLWRVAPRLLQILRILARHHCLGALAGRNHWPPPKELRETIEELGLTFIKFGQVLALRRDILPAATIVELELLHDQLPAMAMATVRGLVESELGAPLERRFSDFRETPLAAATIAQVHEATTLDGRHVAVKVQRPGLKGKIAKDIAALTFLVRLLEKLYPAMRALDLPVIVQELANSLHRETDFLREAQSMVRFRIALADVPDLWIPKVLVECSTRSVLTMEYSAGERIDLCAKRHPEAMPGSIKTLVKLMLQSIFEDGLFHADPHPGNVFVLPDGRLSLLDFGMTGELDEAMRESLTLLLEGVVKGDARAATEAYLELASASETANASALLVDIKAAIYEIRRSEPAQVSIGSAFDALMRAGTRNGIHNPGEFVMLTRAFVILESMIRELAPDHAYLESFQEEVARLTAHHFTPGRIKDKTFKLARDLERLLADAPADLRRVLRRIAEGNLGRVQAPALEALATHVSRNLERLTLAIAFAALMVGGSMLMIANMSGWHHIFGTIMVLTGFFGMILLRIGSWFRDRGRP